MKETDINNLFFELIRVAIGNQICLSRTPKIAEWQELYTMAKKQCLVGICFANVQKLQVQRQAPNSWGDERGEMLYLQWMGMAAKIQQRNEVLNRQCMEVQKMLAEVGFQSSILKGQGVASLYDNLSLLRQSGEIDIWVDGGMEKSMAWCKEKYGKVEFDYINAHVPFCQDTTSTGSAQVEVELHWRVHSLPNPFANKQLQRWFKEHEVDLLSGTAELKGAGSITVPSNEFNAFFILLHCYHNMFESGLGLRQLMDYYFVLRTQISDEGLMINDEILRLIKEFGMMRFARGVMWIMKYVFGMEDKYLLCEPNEEEGRFILIEVIQNGNFAHHDERKIKVKSKLAQPFVTRIQHNWHLATHYPSEFFWSPVWLVYHFIWKRTR